MDPPRITPVVSVERGLARLTIERQGKAVAALEMDSDALDETIARLTAARAQLAPLAQEPASAVDRRQIYASSNGDRWYLAREAASGHAFVQHQANAASGGQITDLEISAFLTQNPDAPEQRELMKMIGSFVGHS